MKKLVTLAMVVALAGASLASVGCGGGASSTAPVTKK